MAQTMLWQKNPGDRLLRALRASTGLQVWGEAVFPCRGTVRRHAGDGHFKEKECAKSGWVLDPRGPTCVPPGPMGYGRRSDTLSLSKTVSLVPRTGDDEIACERWFSGAGTLVYGSFAGRGAMRHLQGAC